MSDTDIFAVLEVPADSSLDTINRAVRIGERSFGPLIELKVADGKTMLRFTRKPKPRIKALIAPFKDGQPVIPEGAELVTTGEVLLEGTATASAATRDRAEAAS